MKNTKKLFTFSVFVVSIIILSSFFSGCTQNNRPQILNVYTGTQGVTVQFNPNNPPSEVYEGSEVILMAEIWNKGAYTPLKQSATSEGPIFISVNVDSIYFDIMGGAGVVQNANKGVISLSLAGKSQEWPTGEKTIMPVAVLNVSKIPGTRESPTTKIEVSACYNYMTHFSENICVDTDIYSLDKNPVCRNLRTYTYTGQGAPLIVSKIDVDMIPVGVNADLVPTSIPVVDNSGQIQSIGQGQTQGKSIIVEPNFRIYFTNTDTGVVLSSDGVNNPCVSGPYQQGKSIRIKAYLSDTQLTCDDTNLKMYSNELSVRCWLPKDKIPASFELNRNFELPLKVEAEYFYRTTTAKDVKIIRVI